jgi:hypothetical protein
MNNRELECFDGIGRGRWGKEHSDVLAWADSHPLSPWKDPNVDGMPVEEGEYLVIIKGIDNTCTWPEICYHTKNRKSFTTWDSVYENEITYRKKHVKFWMKIPDYK